MLFFLLPLTLFFLSLSPRSLSSGSMMDDYCLLPTDNASLDMSVLVHDLQDTRTNMLDVSTFNAGVASHIPKLNNALSIQCALGVEQDETTILAHVTVSFTKSAGEWHEGSQIICVKPGRTARAAIDRAMRRVWALLAGSAWFTLCMRSSCAVCAGLRCDAKPFSLRGSDYIPLHIDNLVALADITARITTAVEKLEARVSNLPGQ